MIITGNAFLKWVVRCMSAAGIGGLGPHDVLVLHAVNHRARGKKLADICMVMNIEDRHIVSYSLKKLRQRGLVEATRKGHETHYSTTPAGDQVCLRYRQVREECLVKSLDWLTDSETVIGSAASFLRAMTTLYGQAERTATVNQASPGGDRPVSRPPPPEGGR